MQQTTRPEFKQSRETRIIYELFRGIRDRVDPLVTWVELQEATDVQDRLRLYAPIHVALRRVRRDDGLVIENDRRIGYRLVRDNGLWESGRKHIQRSRRISRVGIEKMGCGDITKLNPEERSRHFVNRTVLEMMEVQSRPRTISNVQQMVSRKHNELDEQEMLAAIRDSLNSNRKSR